jgi:hypothetical protein
MEATKIFRLKKTIGQETLVKLMCVIIKSFCDSIKATRTMDAVEILECAEMIIEKYTHDSVKDILLALKRAKEKGMSFYNVVNIPIIFDIITEYMEKKSEWIETRQADEKSRYDGSVRTESASMLAGREREHEQNQILVRQINSRKSEEKELKKAADIIQKALKQ